MPRDRFHDYLDKCERDPVSPGDFLIGVREDGVAAFQRLMADLHDTHKAGKLERRRLSNGSCAYFRKPGQMW